MVGVRFPEFVLYSQLLITFPHGCWNQIHYLWSPLFSKTSLISILTCLDFTTSYFDHEPGRGECLFPALSSDKLIWLLFYDSSFSNPFHLHQNPELLPLLPVTFCLEYYHCFLTFLLAYSLFLLRFILFVSGKLIFLKHCPDYCHSDFNISNGCLLHSGLNKNLLTRNVKAFYHGLPYLSFAA